MSRINVPLFPVIFQCLVYSKVSLCYIFNGKHFLNNFNNLVRDRFFSHHNILSVPRYITEEAFRISCPKIFLSNIFPICPCQCAPDKVVSLYVVT